jgi:hypothetical protein
MGKQSKKFEDLFSEGIYAIQKIESLQGKKRIADIETELGLVINRKISTIKWFRKGNPPSSLFELEQLTLELYRRGNLDLIWAEHFLKTAKHPKWKPFLEEFILKMENTTGSQNNQLYKRIRMECIRQIYINRDVISNNYFEIQATSDSPLQTIRHRIINLPNAIENFNLELTAFSREDSGKITTSLLSEYNHIYVWIINFDPPLKNGQFASYRYRRKTNGSVSISSEEIHQQYKMGLRKNDCEMWSITITAPTDLLLMKCILPENYPILLPPSGGFGVHIGINEHLEEKMRLIRERCFTANYINNQWILELQIHHALLGHSYELQWVPLS